MRSELENWLSVLRMVDASLPKYRAGKIGERKRGERILNIKVLASLPLQSWSSLWSLLGSAGDPHLACVVLSLVCPD